MGEVVSIMSEKKNIPEFIDMIPTDKVRARRETFMKSIEVHKAKLGEVQAEIQAHVERLKQESDSLTRNLIALDGAVQSCDLILNNDAVTQQIGGPQLLLEDEVPSSEPATV
jgi:hypothetical protein